MRRNILEISPMAATFQDLGTRAVTEIDGILADTQLPSSARSTWAKVRAVPAQIVTVLQGDGAKIPEPIRQIRAVLTNTDVSESRRATLLAATTGQLAATVTTLATQLTDGLASIEADLCSAAYPTRPANADSTAELLARDRVKMVADPLALPTDVIHRVAAVLEQALDTDDAVTAWLVCSTWPRDYLSSRFPTFCQDGGLDALRAELDAVVGLRGGPAAQAAQQALAKTGYDGTAGHNFTGPYAAGALRLLVAQLPSVLAQVTRQARLAAGDLGERYAGQR